MRQHCAQCLTDVLANGRQAPSGEVLCPSCYSALWGPSATEELRALVRLHTGRPRRGNGTGHLNGGRVAAAQH